MIVERAQYLVVEIPTGPNDDYNVENYFKDVASAEALATAQRALQALPLGRIVDPSAVLCIFEMQDALHIAKQVLEQIEQDRTQWPAIWAKNKYRLGSAKIHATNAQMLMRAALKDAEITDHLMSGSGSASLGIEATGEGSSLSQAA
ncbi:hypothetical protein R8510_05289 [Ralstonia chuxiongensis]|nr:hypothetical protein R8510_05289 [Ralstonia chuxiongensis]